MRDKPISIRVPDDLLDKVDIAAGTAQLSRSAWICEVLNAAVTSGYRLPELVVALGLTNKPPAANGHRRWTSPNPRLGMSIAARSCLHPAHLITRYPTFDRCACGDERYR